MTKPKGKIRGPGPRSRRRRQYLPKGQARTVRRVVLCTPDEARLFLRACRACNMSFSGWARAQLYEVANRTVRPERKR